MATRSFGQRVSVRHLQRGVRMRLLRGTRGVDPWKASVLLLAFALALAFACAVQGLSYDDKPLDRSWTDALYRTLTLLAFGADWTLPSTAPTPALPLPWTVEVARFLLPLIALIGVLVGVIRPLSHWAQLRLMPRSDHTVLCGLGQAGLAYVRQLEDRAAYLAHGPLVVIERRADNPNVAYCRGLGVPVIVGDALSPNHRALDQAGCARARRIVGLLREDRENVEFVLRTQQYLRAAQRRRLDGNPEPASDPDADSPEARRIIAQVNEPHLLRRLETYEKIAAYSKADVRFHNIHTLQAQQLLTSYPPELFADLFGRTAPHFAVYGFGRLGQQVVTEIIRLCQGATGDPPRITIVDRDVAQVRRVIAREFPDLAIDSFGRSHFVVEWRAPLEHEFTPPVVCDALLDDLFKRHPIPTQHIVCLGDEEMALSLGLSLRDQLMARQGANAPVFVRTRSRRGMASLLDSNADRREVPDGLYPFGTLEGALDHRSFDNLRVEALARALHECGYVAHYDDPADSPAAQAWHTLDDLHRRTNRLAVLHLDSKFRAVGLRRIRAGAQAPQAPDSAAGLLPHGALERMARMEQRRYVASRLVDGWRQNDTRSDPLRRHYTLRPWDELDEVHHRTNRQLTAILPDLVRADTAAVVEKVLAQVEANTVETDTKGTPDRERIAASVRSAVEEVRPWRERVRSERRVAVIGPIGACTVGAPAALDLAGFERRLAKRLDAEGVRAQLQGAAVTLMSPLLHLLERRAVSALFRDLAGPGAARDLRARASASAEVPADPEAPDPRRPFDYWSRQVEVLALLPLPYDFVREQGAVFVGGCAAPEGDAARFAEQQEDRFTALIGRRYVRYLEMPLATAPGTELSVQLPEAAAAKLPQRWQRQWQLTAAYLIARCETIVLLRLPEGHPDGLDEIAGWAQAPETIPVELRAADTGLVPPPGPRRVVEICTPQPPA